MSILPYECGGCEASYYGEGAAEGCCDGEGGAVVVSDGDTNVGL